MDNAKSKISTQKSQIRMIDLAPANPYGLTLKTPVLTAAGCFGYGVEYARTVDLASLGGVVTRSTSLRARRSQPLSIVETPAGLLTVGAWSNPGLAYVLKHYAPVWSTWTTPVILGLVGDSPDEYAQAVGALEGIDGIAGVELHVTDDNADITMIV